jgi:hypothetical protein
VTSAFGIPLRIWTAGGAGTREVLQLEPLRHRCYSFGALIMALSEGVVAQEKSRLPGGRA